MAITINGTTNTIGGLAAGGLPDACIQEVDLAAGVNTITQIDEWNLHTQLTGNADPLTNLERNDTQFALIGSGMSETSSNSGIFTFPETGIYHILAQAGFKHTSAAEYHEMNVWYSINSGGAWSKLTDTLTSQSNSSGTYYTSTFQNGILDVTDESEFQMKLVIAHDDTSSYTLASTSRKLTGFTVIRLGDT